VFICQTVAELRCRNNQLSLLAFGASGFPIRADKGADEYDDVRGNHCKQRPKKDGVTHNFPSPLQAPYVRGVVNFELSPLVPPKDRRHCALVTGNDGPIISVVLASRIEASAEVSTDCEVRKQEGRTWPFPH
jgi:hypothetical protein